MISEREYKIKNYIQEKGKNVQTKKVKKEKRECIDYMSDYKVKIFDKNYKDMTVKKV